MCVCDFTIQVGYDYRQLVSKAISNLQILDDLPVTGEECRQGTPSNFDKDWNFLEQLQNDGTIGSLDSMEEPEQSGKQTLFLNGSTLEFSIL